MSRWAAEIFLKILINDSKRSKYFVYRIGYKNRLIEFYTKTKLPEMFARIHFKRVWWKWKFQKSYRGGISLVQDQEKGFLSNLFLVGRNDMGQRPVTTLKQLNKHILYEHFKMEFLL